MPNFHIDQSPAVATLNDIVYLAFKNRDTDTVTFIKGVYKETATTNFFEWLSLGEVEKVETQRGVCIIAYKDDIFMVYVKKGTNELLYCIYKDNKWTTPAEINSNISSGLPPALVVYDGKLWLFYKGANNSSIYYTTYNGKNWESVLQIHKDVSPKTSAMPTAIVIDGEIRIFYKGQLSSTDIYFSTNRVEDHNRWDNDKMVEGNVHPRTSTAPNASIVNDKLWLLYKGCDNNKIYKSFLNSGKWIDDTPITVSGEHIETDYAPFALWHSKSERLLLFYKYYDEIYLSYSKGNIAEWYGNKPLFISVDSIAQDLFETLGGRQGKYYQVTYNTTEKNKVEILQTPNLWGYNYTDNSSLPFDNGKILDEIENTIAKAEKVIDITSLFHYPDDYFFQAIVRGIKRVSTNVKITIFVGITGFLPWELAAYAQGQAFVFIDNLVKNGLEDYDVTVGYIRTGLKSWNHSKIIAVDGKEAIVGGQNLWSTDYLGQAPVHDLNMKVTGQAVLDAHDFCTYLFQKSKEIKKGLQHKYGALFNLRKQNVNPRNLEGVTRTEANDTIKMLSLGDLGYGLTNDSDASIHAGKFALKNMPSYAANSIKLSQQDLGYKYTDLTNWWNTDFMKELAKAIIRGVRVEIVMSNYGAKTENGVKYDNDGITAKDTYGALKWYIEQNPKAPKGAKLDALLKEKVAIAYIRCSDSFEAWKIGAHDYPLANHAKLWIVDDKAFYIGSNNVYFCELQEYGYLVDDQATTKKLLDEYWNKLWQYSKRTLYKF